jgi:hypothetical protein
MPLLSASDYFERAASVKSASLDCNSCAVPLNEPKTGIRQMADDTFLCSNCYFDALEMVVEAHPIIPSRLRRRVVV